MSLRLLFSSSQEAQFLHRIEIPISYSALYFRVTGTNGATPAALRDVGRLRFSIRQQPVIDADADYLASLSNHWFGSNEFSSTGSGAFNFSVMLPRSFLGDKNVERVTKQDAAIFETTFTPTFFTNIASGFLAELYAVTAEGPQTYNLLLFQQAYPTIAAGQVYTDDLSTVENVVAAYISDVVGGVLTLVGSNLDRLRARKGDVDTDVSRTAAMAYTATKYAIEGAANPSTSQLLAELFGLDGSDLSTRLMDTYKLTVQTGTGGSAVPQILTVGFKPNPDRMSESRAEIIDRLQRVERDKQAAGKTRALQVLKALT